MYYKWEGVISSKECEEIITEYKDVELKDGLIDGGKEDEARCALIHFVDRESMLTRMVMSFMTEANERFFRYNMSGAEQVQFAKYGVGGKYDWHMDTHERYGTDN
jgi:predicted 2-oxoglutarate/Fe(II)-dependent dioxygenase YbiX